MRLDEAAAAFIENARRTGSSARAIESYGRSLDLLCQYFPREATIDDLSPERLRDFIARWYVENRVTEARRNPARQELNPPAEQAHANLPGKPCDEALAYQSLVSDLTDFFNRADESLKSDLAARCIPVLAGFKESAPRAIAITLRLTEWLRDRGGAFNFPEFLTSFEDGGHSLYDVGAGGEAGAIESYFRVTRAGGSSIEAEDLNTDELIAPITLPEEVAELLGEGYVINLELVRARGYWQVTACGFCYPPQWSGAGGQWSVTE